jgi:hypothetical protein
MYKLALEDEAREQAEAERQARENAKLARERTLQSAVLAEYYKYRRIEDPYGTRLLVLDSGDGTEPLSGRLEDLRIYESNSYKALSYVWGEPQMTGIILLDGKRLAITESLETALRRLRPATGKPALRIWIDQICINQRDTVERNQQVQLMHAIYRRASQVLVWLGANKDGHASRAFQLARSLRSIFSDKLLTQLCQAKGANLDWFPTAYWKSMGELTAIPWFSRAWIPQEIGTDTEAILQWGSEKISWLTLHDALRKLEIHGWEMRKKHKIRTYRVTLLFQRFVEPPQSADDTPEKRSFVYQLCLGSRNLATDPRDYIFSQLGHYSAWIASEQALIIQPDYDNTVAAIYQEIAIRVLTLDSTLTLLNAVSDTLDPSPPLFGTDSLPSWVPRWHRGRSYLLIGVPGRYRAQGSRSSGITKSSFEEKYTVLVVQGLEIDVIDKLTGKFARASFIPGQSSKDKDRILTAWRLCCSTIPSQSSKGDSSNFTTRGCYREDDSFSMLRAFLDTLAPTAAVNHLISAALPSINTGSSSTPYVCAAYHSGIAALGKLFDSSEFSRKTDPRKLISTSAVEAKVATELNSNAWMQAAESHAMHRRFAVTKKDRYYAMVPPTTQTGDIVCLLYGGETPYVLRPDPKVAGRYRFVGEVYIPGLMGEDARKLLNGENETQNFRLY